MSKKTLLIECVQVAEGAPSQICPSTSTGQIYSARLIEVALPEQKESEFDYTQAGSLWGAAFCSVILLYVIGQLAGAVLGFIRR